MTLNILQLSDYQINYFIAMSLTERIKALALAVSSSENEFATKVLGYKSNSSYNSFIEKGNPRFNAIENIIKKTGVNPTWLILGQGEMFSSKVAKEQATKSDVDFEKMYKEAKADASAFREAMISALSDKEYWKAIAENKPVSKR